MFIVSQRNSRPAHGVLMSIAAHAACLGLLVLALHLHRSRPVMPQSRCCSVSLVWTGPMQSGVSAPHPAARLRRHSAAPAPPSAPHTSPLPVRLPQATPSQPAMATQQPSSMVGSGTGDDDAEPAFPVYFPQPGIADRSLLPSTEQKIIVNVDISAQGNVTDETLVQGLGNGLDNAVLAAVRSWRFHPATLNGAPVASVQELVFPFSRSAPSGGETGTPG
ncbi:MAG TPA: energy transducer TonB [Acidobacteriaceae bacterium]|nr:energy transducer TonB [Acidobacteriaceae bacterium]